VARIQLGAYMYSRESDMITEIGKLAFCELGTPGGCEKARPPLLNSFCTHHGVSVQGAQGGLLAGADGHGGGQESGLSDGQAGGENDELREKHQS